MNAVEFVQSEAARFGVTLDDSDADHILWGFTGFPCFWSQRGPHEEGVTTVEECLGFEVRVHLWDSAFRRWLGLPPPVDYCEEYSRQQKAGEP